MSMVDTAIASISRAIGMRICGRVAAVRGLIVLVDDLPLPVGSMVRIGGSTGLEGRKPLLGEIVAIERQQCVVMVLGQTDGIRAGDQVLGLEASKTGRVGPKLLGRVIDGLGRPIDDLGIPSELRAAPLSPPPLAALRRARVSKQLLTGVRVIDLLTPLGKGQRLGVFAGPGVGKSTLLGTIAQRASSDVNVIALIGERGREVRDFIEHSLGPEGLARSVVIVATGDEPPLMRIRAARLACCVAEHFRDAGKDVLLMMDSVTRFAHAQRQVGLSAGEPPTTKGYTPSVFAMLGLLLERAGALEGVSKGGGGGGIGGGVGGGSITGLYTVLVEGDDMTEPVADAARGILDGHIILSRRLAQRGHFPAVDVLDSVSRVAGDITDERCGKARRQILRMLAAYRDVEDLIQIGAYARGAKPESDIAVECNPAILDILRQSGDDRQAHPEALARFLKLAEESARRIDGGKKP
ncbi:MAG: FliI/YscN family ATPase [Planctomycetota bacterium]|nr:FliI/YscN family ATPase [Planctomycetota bacterium]